MHQLASGFEFISRGGFMMYPLLISGLAALTVIVERLFTFKSRFEMPNEHVRAILEKVRAGQLQEAEAACRSKINPLTSIISSGVEHFSSPIAEMENAMKNRAEEWIPRLEKRVDIIDTVITAAPLMGLLGTITGMMASFRVLSEKGVNEPNAITGGVAEALIATATGLVIALICLIFFNYFSTKIKNFIYELESVASRLIEIRMSVQRKNQV